MRTRFLFARRLIVACTAVCIGVATVGFGSAQPAAAADNPDWWFSAMAIPDVHAQGLTGEGIRIAVIDDMIDPNSPALAGANVTVNDEFVCPESVGIVDGSTGTIAHGTAVTQLLVRPARLEGLPGGIVPDAEIDFLAIGDVEVCSALVRDDNGEVIDQWANAVDYAVENGADIISISLSGAPGDRKVASIARALAAGVVVVASSPNAHAEESMYFPDGLNGVVSVAAVSSTMDLVAEDDGSPVVNEEVTVVNAGIGIGMIGGTADAMTTETMAGSSFATPLTAGVLALAMQKHPEATGNQIIQALISTTVNAQEGLARDTKDGYGYGLVSLPGILAADASSYADENPLMDRSYGEPTAADIEAAGPASEESPDPQPSTEPPVAAEPSTGASTDSGEKPTSSENSDSSALPWILGSGGVVLIGAVVIFVAISRHRRGNKSVDMRGNHG